MLLKAKKKFNTIKLLEDDLPICTIIALFLIFSFFSYLLTISFVFMHFKYGRKNRGFFFAENFPNREKISQFPPPPKKIFFKEDFK